MSHPGNTTIHHDLGNVLENLRALEVLLFAPVDERKRESYRKTYRELLVRLERIQRQAQTIDNDPAPESGKVQ